MSSLLLKIITPVGVSFEGTIDQVSVPTTDGVITILPSHIPLVALVSHGELIAETQGERTSFAVFSGVVEVKAYHEGVSEVVLLVDSSEEASSIQIEEAEAAYTRAKEAMTETMDRDMEALQSRMEKELQRIRIARKDRAR